MRTTIHRAEERGTSNLGWLKSAHSFSFASFYHPQKMGFGQLRVLNDDHVAPAMGFGTHSHQNMEIISIPLKGTLEHKDSMGNISVIEAGDIQVMSAGKGIQHSEFNKSKTESVDFLQIWVIPDQHNITPRYQQVKLAGLLKPNAFSQILSPDPDAKGVWIHQKAFFSLGTFDSNIVADYKLNHSSNGLYVFVIEGKISVDQQVLGRRDALAAEEVNELSVVAIEKSEVLLMEIPLTNG